MHWFKRLATLAYLATFSPDAFAAIGPVTDLTIKNVLVSPDGSVERGAVTAKGGVPGPLITGKKGDNFKVNVINELDNSTMLLTTSIHWHGIYQLGGTNCADGPAFVNQCPIASGDSFLYDFNIPDQASTFWYHSHLATQYCDGLRGPMVVYDPNDPYLSDYDIDNDDTVITVSDWYHDVAPSIVFPPWDATLINGQGRYSDGTTVTNNDLAVVSVTQGCRYRFRIVNMACAPNYTFQIYQHKMTVIEADGVNHQKLDVDQFTILVGQRYSVLVTADQPIENYWIRAKPDSFNTTFIGGLNSAILRYVGANETEPADTAETSTQALVERNLVPLENPGVQGGGKCQHCADKNINLDLRLLFNFTDFNVSGSTYRSPSTPVLLQILSGASAAQDLMPSGSLYELPKNSSIQISIPPQGLVGGPHPFHLHGHTFDVVRSAGQTDYNWDTPPRRDVVSIGDDGDNVTVRLFTDNAGPWFLHCHIDWHLDRGLAVVFVEDFEDIKSEVKPPQQWDDLCPTYDKLTPAQLGGID